MKISTIVPAFNMAGSISACIDSLLVASGPDDEVIVVDDGSTDDTFEYISASGDPRVIAVRSESNIGRGPARNLGVGHASGEILVFVDADVAVHPTSLSSIRRAFVDEGVDALIGSYDDSPRASGFVSQFRNLLHHHVHHHSGPIATHFWTGLGAVRADAFREVGGFDEGQWARNMEDVELGHRLTDSGRVIRVRPEIQGKHLKRFTVGSMVRSDLLERAIPWVHLTIVDHRADRFVLSGGQRRAGVLTAALVLAVVLAIMWPPGWMLAALAAVLWAYVNRAPLRTFARLRGRAFALFTAPLLFVHIATADIGLIAGVATHRRASRRAADIARDRGNRSDEHR